MKRPILLDLFCGAGGCAVGYHRAGFDVVGVDNRSQPRYPFDFVQADALEYVREHGREFDAIHASPPCQRYSTVNNYQHREGKEYPDLLPPTRELLVSIEKPWVIENVRYAPMSGAIQLCGSSFGLPIRRHRLFEASFVLFGLPCSHGWQRRSKERYPTCFQTKGAPRRTSTVVQIYGNTCGVRLWPSALGIDWMNRYEMTQAIPPAYTEFVGRQLLNVVSPS